MNNTQSSSQSVPLDATVAEEEKTIVTTATTTTFHWRNVSREEVPNRAILFLALFWLESLSGKNYNNNKNKKSNKKHTDDDEGDEVNTLEDACDCRLHQALCWIKAEEYDEAMDASNIVLAHPSGVVVSSAVRAPALYRRSKARLAQNKYVEQQNGNDGDDSASKKYSNNYEQARNDARMAAILGDRKAMELYGQLL